MKAPSALTPSGSPIIADLEEKLGCLLVAVLVVLLIGLMGKSARLTCSRDVEGGSVNCVRQSRTLWVIPLGSKEIRDVRAAFLSQGYFGEYCSPCYRVDLRTEQGIVPLTVEYSSGSNDKINAINKINNFVSGTQPGNLVVTESWVFP